MDLVVDDAQLTTRSLIPAQQETTRTAVETASERDRADRKRSRGAEVKERALTKLDA